MDFLKLLINYYINLFKLLFRKIKGKSKPRRGVRKIPAVDFKRVTRTGKVKAIGGEGNHEWFGVDKAIYKVQGLTKSAKKVYVYLSRIADSRGYCYPFYKTIAKRCNISISTVSKALNELEKKGLVMRLVHRYSRRGVSSNIYRLRKINERGV